MTAPALMWSTTGTSGWTATTSPFDNYGVVRSIAYGASKFVAVGYIWTYSAGSYVQKAAIATSPDGKVWTQQTSVTADALLGVAFGGGKFVANGSLGGAPFLEYSSDGVTWTQCTYSLSGNSPAQGGPAITYTGSKFVMVYNAPSGGNVSATTIESTDGITFSGGSTANTQAGLYSGDIGYGGSNFVVGSYAGEGYYSTSSNDSMWSTYADATMTPENYAMFATYQNSDWWVGSGEQVAKSTDASTWSTQTIAAFSGGSVMALLYQSGTFLLGGASGYSYSFFYPGVLQSSTDGASWSSVTIPSNAPGIRALIYADSIYVAGGEANLSYAPPGIPTSLACGPD